MDFDSESESKSPPQPEAPSRSGPKADDHDGANLKVVPDVPSSLARHQDSDGDSEFESESDFKFGADPCDARACVVRPRDSDSKSSCSLPVVEDDSTPSPRMSRSPSRDGTPFESSS